MNELKVLIIEDDEALAASLDRFLSELAETTVSHDGFEGRCWGRKDL